MSEHSKGVRKDYLDHLRVIAVVAVITIHVSAAFYGRFKEMDALGWWMSNLLNAASRFAVPVFVMISGALLLGRNLSVIEFYRKRSARILPPLIFWNLFFIGFAVVEGANLDAILWTLKAGLFIDGYSAIHLWYLSMYLCLMLFAPFINQFLVGSKPSQGDLRILLVAMFLIFSLNEAATIAQHIFGLYMGWFKIFPWYIAYFVAGYYIDRYGSAIPVRTVYLAAAILFMTAIGAWLNYVSAASFGILKDYFILGNHGPFVFVISMLIFLLARKSIRLGKRNEVVSKIAEASFGIYLIHPVFVYAMKSVFPSYYSTPLISMPATIVVAAVGSFFVITMLRKIDLMKRLC